MKIVNLVEDTAGREGCIYEHGLSFYLETKEHKLLMDTGASDAFMENAGKLGIDLSQVDTVILSHGHYDHSGGILPFVRQNSQAVIYMQRTAGEDYFSIRESGETYIGIDKDILKLPQVCLIEGNKKIDEELFLFAGITGRRFPAKSNQRLKRRDGSVLVQDTFGHEQCLVVKQGTRHILLSGCAHNGILNILDRYREIYGNAPDIVISGFHMIRKAEYSEEEIAVIRGTAEELAGLRTIFYTGHCTGKAAYEIMKEVMGEQLREIHSGMRIE